MIKRKGRREGRRKGRGERGREGGREGGRKWYENVSNDNCHAMAGSKTEMEERNEN